MILVVTKNFKKNYLPGAEILAHKVENVEKCHGRLDPTLRMREVVHGLNRVPTRAKQPAFHPDVFSVKKDYFSFRSFHGLQGK